MARSGYLPRVLANINHKFKTPHWALVVSGAVSCIFIYNFKTDQIIMLSVLGAVVMYIMSMLSIFILRKKEPRLNRPFTAPLYPVFPAIALIICIVCLFASIYFNPDMSLIFAGGLAIVLIIFVAMGKHKVALNEDMMNAPSEEVIESLGH
jgi:ethanolamine permease